MRELQAAEEYQFDEDELNELEELEAGNMFDEPVDEEPEAPTVNEDSDPLAFAANYVEHNE
jgi:hypothetical protein